MTAEVAMKKKDIDEKPVSRASRRSGKRSEKSDKPKSFEEIADDEGP